MYIYYTYICRWKKFIGIQAFVPIDAQAPDYTSKIDKLITRFYSTNRHDRTS